VDVLQAKVESQLVEGCRRLARKGFLNDRLDSVSARIPGTTEMLFIGGLEDWHSIGDTPIAPTSFASRETAAALHGGIYLARPDVGAVVISSPSGVRLLAAGSGALPPLFDEQVRHIGLPSWTPPAAGPQSKLRTAKAFRRGANAALLDGRLVCLGMTIERAIHNTDLLEKCARAYVLAQASGSPVRTLPAWVQFIANRRLQRDERSAEASYAKGELPEGTTAY
jgi:ribulose-5-phosphate 4-epimerase/fuculose-1-phosphate aldolase